MTLRRGQAGHQTPPTRSPRAPYGPDIRPEGRTDHRGGPGRANRPLSSCWPGRPYARVDPEVNHGIDRLITCSRARPLFHEDCHHRPGGSTVQGRRSSTSRTCHPRLVRRPPATLHDPSRIWTWCSWFSFGCGVDAITTDETREILQRGGKLYTQLKIDEITNLGAVNIRLRSLFAALDAKGRRRQDPCCTETT